MTSASLMFVAVSGNVNHSTGRQLELLLAGIVCLAIGLPYATNFRGRADRWADARADGRDWKRPGFRRLVGFVGWWFTVGGVYVTVVALVMLSGGPFFAPITANP